MKRGAAIVVAAALAAAGYAYWYSDERQIVRLLQAVAASASQDEPLGMPGMARVAGLRTLLAPDISIDPGPPAPGPIVGAAEVIAAVTRVRSAFPVVHVTFVDVQVAVGRDEAGAGAGAGTATVHATLRVQTRTAAGDESVDARELVLSVHQRDGRWVIAAVKTVPVLERVAGARAGRHHLTTGRDDRAKRESGGSL